MKSYDIILFDLDGTVIDSSPGVTDSIIYALKKFGIEIKDKTSLLKCIGPPLQYSFKNFFGFSDEDTALAIKYYREFYEIEGINRLSVYDGIPELLKNLKNAGKTIVLATSKPEKYAAQILKDNGLYDLFDFVAGADPNINRNEKTEVMEYALKSINADPSKVLMIGDRKYDVIGSKDVGCDCIGVLFGFGTKEELLNEGAIFTAETCDEVEKYILG